MRTRATKPYAITIVAQRRSKASVSTTMTTTPAATRRAETSFTGLGNEKNALTRLAAVSVLRLVLMTDSLDSLYLDVVQP